MTSRPPSLALERRILAEGAAVVIGCDEVGRGAIAGPVAVGVAVLDPSRSRIPAGLRDSKLLPEPVREQLAPRVVGWSAGHAVGLASNDEIDAGGLSRALSLAGARALLALTEAGVRLREAVVVLDGNWDYLRAGLELLGVRETPRVVTRVKADRDCASVAAASVIAKVHRDRMLIERHESHPHYAWRSNKGYASRTHYAAIDAHGPSDWHRLTWLHAAHERPASPDRSDSPAGGRTETAVPDSMRDRR